MSRSGGRLIALSMLAAVGATVSAVNLTLTYVFFAVDHPGISIASFVPIMAIGSVPFLTTAGLFAWSFARSQPWPGPADGHEGCRWQPTKRRDR